MKGKMPMWFITKEYIIAFPCLSGKFNYCALVPDLIM